MGTGKKKIKIEKITKETSRMVTFSKRRQGLFKKMKELELLSDYRVASVVFSPTGRPYTCGDVNAAIERHFSTRNMESSTSGLNKHHDSNPDVAGKSSGSKSSSTPRSSGLRGWVESIDVEDCQNMNLLMLLKAQLEGTRKKLAEDSEGFQALFV